MASSPALRGTSNAARLQAAAFASLLPLYEPLWATVTEEGFPSAKSCCMILERDGEIVGGMLGCIIRVLLAKLLYINIPYGGVIGQSPPREDLARLLKDFCKAKGVARVTINTFSTLAEPPTAGFTITPLSTSMLALFGKSKEEIRMGFKSSCRRSIKKAERSGVSIEEALCSDGGSVFYDLYLASMRRNEALPKYAPEWVNALLNRIVTEGKGTLLLARRGPEAIAGMLIVDSEIRPKSALSI